MTAPNTPDGWTAVKTSFYNDLLAANRELMDALKGVIKYDVSNAYPHTAEDWNKARKALEDFS